MDRISTADALDYFDGGVQLGGLEAVAMYGGIAPSVGDRIDRQDDKSALSPPSSLWAHLLTYQ